MGRREFCYLEEICVEAEVWSAEDCGLNLRFASFLAAMHFPYA